MSSPQLLISASERNLTVRTRINNLLQVLLARSSQGVTEQSAVAFVGDIGKDRILRRKDNGCQASQRGVMSSGREEDGAERTLRMSFASFRFFGSSDSMHVNTLHHRSQSFLSKIFLRRVSK